jgi:hypothetical protein
MDITQKKMSAGAVVKGIIKKSIALAAHFV